MAEMPGCFSDHQDRDEAIARVPQAIEEHLRWCAANGIAAEPPDGAPAVAEMVDAWVSEHDFEVNAFFAADRPPVREDELGRYEPLLAARRADLLAALEGCGPDELAPTGEFAGSVGDVVLHVGGAENWYLESLGLGLPREGLAPDPLEAVAVVREHLLARLGDLAAFEGISQRVYEIWSARKVLRRALWHERDHTQHVLQLRGRA